MSFNQDLFIYNKETHTGTYEGKPIPSVTQLLEILFPMSEDIPQKRLEQAADRGTTIHEAIEQINEYFDNPFDYQHNIDVAIEVAEKVANYKNIPELIDYVSFIATYKLRPYDYENLIFLLDENGELICFGHYDCVFQATQDIRVGETDLFIEDYLYMFDFKTTSLFAKKKTQLQTSIYSLAYEQMSKNFISNTYGLWLRDDSAKLIPLHRQDNKYVIELCKQLKTIWLNTLSQA